MNLFNFTLVMSIILIFVCLFFVLYKVVELIVRKITDVRNHRKFIMNCRKQQISEIQSRCSDLEKAVYELKEEINNGKRKRRNK